MSYQPMPERVLNNRPQDVNPVVQKHSQTKIEKGQERAVQGMPEVFECSCGGQPFTPLGNGQGYDTPQHD